MSKTPLKRVVKMSKTGDNIVVKMLFVYGVTYV